jgi:hypothetical protein
VRGSTRTWLLAMCLFMPLRCDEPNLPDERALEALRRGDSDICTEDRTDDKEETMISGNFLANVDS